MGVASNTRTINKPDKSYSLENVSTNWNRIVSTARELGHHEDCRVDSVGPGRLLVNTIVETKELKTN